MYSSKLHGWKLSLKTNELIFSHPWHIVVGAAFKKYPNPENEDILGIDVIKQRLRNGVLYSERIIQSNFHIPVWASKV